MVLELSTDILLSLQTHLKVYFMIPKKAVPQKPKNPKVSEKSIICASCVHKKVQKFFETTIGYICIWHINGFMRSLLVFSVDLFEIRTV